MVVVYKRPLQRRYLAPRLSSAYCLSFLVTGVIVVLPFFIAYSASGPNFWTKAQTYQEQPSALFEHRFVLLLEGSRATGADTEPLSLFFSSSSKMNTALGGEALRIPVVKSREVDNNLDGVFDSLEFSAVMPLAPGEAVLSASLFLFFELRFTKWAKAVVHSAGLLGHASPLPGKGLHVDGALDFGQTKPFPARSGFFMPYGPLLDEANMLPWTRGNASLQHFFPNLVRE